VKGFVQIPFGGTATPYLTQADTGHECQGCHAVSKTGLIAYTYDGDSGALALKRVDDKTDVNPNAGIGNFKTFSPDGKYLLATDRGRLQLLDGATGAYLGDVRNQGDVTQPDWSPDGTIVAVTMFMGTPADSNYAPTDIAVMDVIGDGQFSEPRILVDVTPPWRAYYPAWSPDGKWLAYNLYSDPDAELWVIDRDGLRPPVRLDAANQAVPQSDSWPRWGPLPDDEVLWLAFSSVRPYGYVVSAIPQIWVAGFDPGRAEQGLDPTWPAFWLPGQDPTTANHIPLWIDP
jgi:Tol biopolymer transport system component